MKKTYLKLEVKRYFLYEDLMDEDFKGIYVDLIQSDDDYDFTDFWIGCVGYTVRDFMFSIPSVECDTDEKALQLIKSNVYDYLNEFIYEMINSEEDCWDNEDEDAERCCICGEKIHGHGCNPSPVKEEGNCCRKCDMEIVIPTRMRMMAEGKY